MWDLVAIGASAAPSTAAARATACGQAPTLGALPAGARLSGAIPLTASLSATRARRPLVLIPVRLFSRAREVSGAMDVQVRLCHESIRATTVGRQIRWCYILVRCRIQGSAVRIICSLATCILACKYLVQPEQLQLRR